MTHSADGSGPNSDVRIRASSATTSPARRSYSASNLMSASTLGTLSSVARSMLTMAIDPVRPGNEQPQALCRPGEYTDVGGRRPERVREECHREKSGKRPGACRSDSIAGGSGPHVYGEPAEKDRKLDG